MHGRMPNSISFRQKFLAMRIENRKARYEYNILERFEAGIVLQGQEVKSIREGNVSLSDSYCTVLGDELFVVGLHISPYPHSREKLDPKRRRKLLLHRSELNRLIGKISQRGLTFIPLNLYFNSRGIAKLEVALCHGKKKHDKREAIKQREIERQIRAQNSA